MTTNERMLQPWDVPLSRHRSDFDRDLLTLANETIDLLIRAKRLGYRIRTDDSKLRELVELLGELQLHKDWS